MHRVECGKFWAAMNEVPPHSLYLVPGIRDRRLSKAQSPLDGQVTSLCLSLPPPRPHRRAHAHTVLGTQAAKTRRTRLSSNLPGILSHNSGSETGDPSTLPSNPPQRFQILIPKGAPQGVSWPPGVLSHPDAAERWSFPSSLPRPSPCTPWAARGAGPSLPEAALMPSPSSPHPQTHRTFWTPATYPQCCDLEVYLPCLPLPASKLPPA